MVNNDGDEVTAAFEASSKILALDDTSAALSVESNTLTLINNDDGFNFKAQMEFQSRVDSMIEKLSKSKNKLLKQQKYKSNVMALDESMMSPTAKSPNSGTTPVSDGSIELDYVQETKQYLSENIDSVPAEPVDWMFYHHSVPAKPVLPNIRCGALCDIGTDKLISIGGKGAKNDYVLVHEIDKSFGSITRLRPPSAVGNPQRIPCCRFSNSATFIPPIRCILFFGGFNSASNFNDAALLSVDDNKWHSLTFDVDIDFRAHHATATRMAIVENEKSGKMSQQFEVYIFGGQYCSGGPYEYHNDIFKFTFSEFNRKRKKIKQKKHVARTSFPVQVTAKEVKVRGDVAPCPRSMSNCWIKGDNLYIFGGSRAESSLNDLWTLNLVTKKWTEIKYQGILGPPKTKKFVARDFCISGKQKPSYFDAERNELILIHYGAITGVQTQYKQWFDGNLEEFEEAVSSGKVQIKKGKGGMHVLGSCTVFTLNLNDMKWRIRNLPRNFMTGNVRGSAPSSSTGSTQMVRIGEYLVMMGGDRNKKLKRLKDLYFLKIPVRAGWCRKRLLWIGYQDDECVFSKCAKVVIQLIISFLN